MTTWLLWCDLESTGLDTDLDEIIEAAFILTKADTLEVVGRYYSLVTPTDIGYRRLMSTPKVLEMHTKNGLLNHLANVSEDYRPPISKLDVRVCDWLELSPEFDLRSDDTVHLAGSGIANFDRPLIRRLMPDLDAKLHYAPIDVGVLRRTWKMWTGSDVTGDNDAKNHRAMSDVEGHLREARAFRERFKVVDEVLRAKD